MDKPLSPPLRIQVISATDISEKTSRKRLAAFVDEFQSRNTSAQGGNTAITVQLQKLIDALKEGFPTSKEKKGQKKHRLGVLSSSSTQYDRFQMVLYQSEH